jgi:ATP-binding cassette subfamily A (ABC1) protein 3
MTKLLDGPSSSNVKSSGISDIAFQIKLLLWKRYAESTKSKVELLKLLGPSVAFFVLMILIYNVIKGLFFPDGLEPFIVPLAFWIFMQRIVVQLMSEKSSRLQESMRMMGLYDIAYWTSYFISEGIITGFILSFTLTLFTVGGLFNAANFGVILGLMFVFCLSAVPFCFFLCAFFSTPQTSGQATLGVLLGSYILYTVLFVAGVAKNVKHAQIICCFFPPLALQIGSGAFLDSWDGISISTICGIMFADIFIWALLAWYFNQVMPSEVGVPKPFYFPLQPRYWFPNMGKSIEGQTAELEVGLNDHSQEDAADQIPVEAVNEALTGKPTVVVNKLKKTFGSQPPSVNDLSFNMYENQIFALLGHNGAGKTTTISMLTGLIGPDYSGGTQRGAFVYGSSILTEMDQVRGSMGVCPQHDVLFENLTVKEHILFFSQLKGKTYEEADAEAVTLTNLFHLDSRLDHLGHELSGGQRRKLSVAIAVCGGSRFIVLDEPTAGMDPLARRELWDLLSSLRQGRTMLLTTHYMDEADILGDRVGIMSLGAMQCMGTTQFLKNTYGAGYKLVFDREVSMGDNELAALTTFVTGHVPDAKYMVEDGAEGQVIYALPFPSVALFGPFFVALEDKLDQLHVTNFGVTITSLEDVFLKVGEDHTVTPTAEGMKGIGSDRTYESNFHSQVLGMTKRKLTYAFNDFVTIPLLGLPIAAAVAAAALYGAKVIDDGSDVINDVVTAGIYLGGYLGVPGLIAEFIVKERQDKLRNVLTVMGCDFRAYWLGTFIADYLILMIVTICIWITWGAANLQDYYGGMNGLNFFIFLLFNVQLLAFSYFFSFAFSSPKSCITLMPIIIIVLVITPNIINLMGFLLARAIGASVPQSVQGGVLLWGIMILTPHGALIAALLNTTQDYSEFISNFPPVSACIVFMIVESILFLGFCYYTDAQSVAAIICPPDPTFSEACLRGLDEDVLAERERVLNDDEMSESESPQTSYPLRVKRLRKVFPSKVQGRPPVVATQDIVFGVAKGEIFGLLGANGAGKTTTLSMLTRHLVPTSGDAFVTSHSILTDFTKASTHIGVVTQNNSLWDRLSVESHLKLFARLRGVPEDLVMEVVTGTIDQLELTPHRHKLAIRLSGGMKRKLCVAIALIGDPEVVLLDEPSAGLDPVSRRNLWSVILRTMSHRSVILTTHSMDEAEALCKRIGIMVQGQLRVLGTKQHLKTKFGSGFELVVKMLIVDDNLAEQTSRLTAFVLDMFPSSVTISENGGMVTYRIPKEEMKMGLAFTRLQASKEELHIEDYSVAQPTLEQVFIRTVNQHTPSTKRAAAASFDANHADPQGMGMKYNSERMSSFAEDENAASLMSADGLPIAVSSGPKNHLGCTDYCVKIMIIVSLVLFLAFIGGSVGASTSGSRGAGSALAVIGIVSLIVMCVGCVLFNCTACKPPQDED